MNKIFATISLLVMFLVLLFAITFIANNNLRGTGLDLTEDKRYSLSPSTKAILQGLESPIELHYFFSDTSSKGIPSLRNYAAQVQSVLQKYSELGGRYISLNVIDPSPFSEQEDKAAGFGLTAAAVGPAQDSVYFGLAGTNQAGDAMIVGFFDPTKAAFLEYDISRLIYQLSNPEPLNLTIVTDIALMGEQNPVTGELTEPFVFYQQLEELFNITILANSAEALPQKTDMLLVIHPQKMPQSLLYDIDQYLMNDGKAVFLVDPHFESDVLAMMGSVGANRSDMPLLGTYGIEVNLDTVLLDSQAGLEVRGPDGTPVRHFGFLGLGSAQIDRDDVTTGDLDSVNGASFAHITLPSQSRLNMSPLLASTENSGLMPSEQYAAAPEPAQITEGFINDARSRVLAARLSGPASSHFTLDALEVKAGFVSSTQNLNVVIVADVDFLTDRFWVQQSNFFGQRMFSPFANNGDLLINLLENYSGAESLIGLRGRGTYSRPFEKVADIAVKAEARFTEQENRLQQQLQQTESQLAELQSQQADGFGLNAEQQAAIDAFVAKRIETRRALREVQFQLQKDISALGTQLKVINIVVAPVVLTLMLFLMARLLRRRV